MIRAGASLSRLAALAATALATTTPANAGSYRLVYSFQDGNDGGNPTTALIDVGGTLYGTAGGGPYDSGTIFSVNPTTGAVKGVYSFPGGAHGINPHGGLIKFGHRLYGTTIYGGSDNCTYGCGTVFSVNPKTGNHNLVHSFKGGSDGAAPYATLIDVGGTLYGTTVHGGTGACSDGCGTVFWVNPTTGAEAVVYSFKGGSDGDTPYASLISAGGMLYGTTQRGGGSSNYGTVFAVNPTTGAETVLHAFQGGSDGAVPFGNLIKFGPRLYGTAEGGGIDCGGVSCGAVFSVNPNTGAERGLYSFVGAPDGDTPFAGLIDIRGTLYGSTFFGGMGGCFYGKPGCGTVFAFDPKTGAETVVYSFQGGSDGEAPTASLINLRGTLYGTTPQGGSSAACGMSGCGTVFAYTP